MDNTANTILVTRVMEYIATHADDRLVLLRNKEVVQWLVGDLSFLPAIEKKNKTNDTKALKVLEDQWGRATLKVRRPDLDIEKQWTGKFGEHVCQELYVLLGKECSKPAKKNHFCPDWEVDDSIVEVKTETFFTEGTAGEKILGVPLKYADVPTLYGKPLRILCMGGAEKACRYQYGILGDITSEGKKKQIERLRVDGFEYVGVTDILKTIVGL